MPGMYKVRWHQQSRRATRRQPRLLVLVRLRRRKPGLPVPPQLAPRRRARSGSERLMRTRHDRPRLRKLLLLLSQSRALLPRGGRGHAILLLAWSRTLLRWLSSALHLA